MTPTHAQTLQRLRAAFPREEFPDRTVALYGQQLQYLPPEAVARAVENMIRRSRFLPRISEVLTEIAELELRFLTSPKPGRVDHPTTGPVTTKDVADCMAEVVWYLIGDQMTAYLGKDLAEVGVRGSSLSGIHADRRDYSPTGGAGRDDQPNPSAQLADLSARGRGARAPYGPAGRRAPGASRRGWGRR